MWQKNCRVFISKELVAFMPQQFLKTRLCPDSPFSNLTPVVPGPLSLQLQILGNCSYIHPYNLLTKIIFNSGSMSG
jgi:hypothetical protein